MRENTKLIGSLALLAIAALAIVGITMTGGATVATENVTIDDPANNTVEVDVDYSSSLTSSINATAELVNSSGTVVDSQTILGSSGTTETFTLSASSSGDYEINLTSEDETNTTLNETRLIAERTATVVDAANETVYVDLAFQGTENATADVLLQTDGGTTVYTETVSYDATSDQTTYSVAINDSDGLIDDDYNMTATFVSASSYDAAYASVEETTEDTGLFGGEILGQDPTVAIAGLLVLGGGFYYAREEELI